MFFIERGLFFYTHFEASSLVEATRPLYALVHTQLNPATALPHTILRIQTKIIISGKLKLITIQNYGTLTRNN